MIKSITTIVLTGLLWYSLAMMAVNMSYGRVINCHYDNGSDMIVCNDRGDN